MAEIEFWYEFGSTYSYPAAMRIERLAGDAGVASALAPFPARADLQGLWLERLAVQHLRRQGPLYVARPRAHLPAEGLALALPPVRFPQNGLKAARLALIGESEGWTPAFTRAVFAANYAEQKDISDDATLRAILSALGVDADAAFAAANTPREQGGSEASDRGSGIARVIRRAVVHRRR